MVCQIAVHRTPTFFCQNVIKKWLSRILAGFERVFQRRCVEEICSTWIVRRRLVVESWNGLGMTPWLFEASRR